MKKTQDVYDLCKKILDTMSEPYGEDIIEDVFLAIEKNSKWRQEYDNLLVVHGGPDKVNPLIGRYVSEITGMKSVHQRVKASRSKLVESYSKLRY